MINSRLILLCFVLLTFVGCRNTFNFDFPDLSNSEKFKFECSPQGKWIFRTGIKVQGEVTDTTVLLIYAVKERDGPPLWPGTKLIGKIDTIIRSEWGSYKMVGIIKPSKNAEGYLTITCGF